MGARDDSKRKLEGLFGGTKVHQGDGAHLRGSEGSYESHA